MNSTEETPSPVPTDIPSKIPSEIPATHACCSGVRDMGTPTGLVEKVGDVDVYVARPPPEQPQSRTAAIILATDVFGFHIENPRLIADGLARETGLPVYIPDLFHGRELDDSLFEKSEKFKSNGILGKAAFLLEGARKLGYFMMINKQSESMTIVNTLISELEKTGFRDFGAIGYCWGGKIVLTLASATDRKIKCGVANHPGALIFAPSYPKVCEDVSCPFVYCLAEIDNEIGSKQVEKIRSIAAKQQDVNVFWYKGTTHGFAVRGEESIQAVKEARADAFQKACDIFKKYLK